MCFLSPFMIIWYYYRNLMYLIVILCLFLTELLNCYDEVNRPINFIYAELRGMGEVMGDLETPFRLFC